MTKHKIADLLNKSQADLTEFGVASLSLFGSAARGKATEASDVDLLVSFSKPVGYFEFLDLKHYLENLIGARVDLVTEDALKPQLRERILAEAVPVA